METGCGRGGPGGLARRKNRELVAQGTNGRSDEQNINLVLKLFWDWEDWLYQEIRILEWVNSQTVG